MTIRRICIVGLDDYPLFAGEQGTQRVGGESVQHLLLARAWRDLGLQVSVIVKDHGQGARRMIDGIELIAAHRHDAGVPVLRFVHPRLTRLLAALAAADADVYYQSPAGAYTGIAGWFCGYADKRFVFRVASDVNCTPGHQLIQFWRDRKLYEYGLKRADVVATQTAHQTLLLLEHYCVASAVVNMAVEPPPARPQVAKDIDVLWVSNMRTVKRPELALELARRLPRLRFALAGGPMPGAQSYYDDVLEAAARLSNVHVLGPVRYADVGGLFERARLFLNTSSIEGFPNTFLQAWARAVPVVTFFDPDGLIQKQRLGWVANSLDDMSEAIGTLLADVKIRETIGERARDFANREFAPSAVAGRYLDLLAAIQQPRLRFGTTG